MEVKQVGNALKAIGETYLPFEFDMYDIQAKDVCERTWVFKSKSPYADYSFASTNLETFLDMYMQTIAVWMYEDEYDFVRDEEEVATINSEVVIGPVFSDEELADLMNQQQD